MFFMDSSHRLTQSMLNSDVPSVNIRGMMDQVSLQVFDVILHFTISVVLLMMTCFHTSYSHRSKSQIRLLCRQLLKCSGKLV